MGIASKSNNGIIIGRMGNTVGYMLNGQYVVRSLPDKTHRAPSQLTLINRERMKVTSVFLRPLKHILEFGYQSIAPKGSRIGPFQAAQSYVFKNALDYGENNVPYVNPEKVLVFRGPLGRPQEFTVVRNGRVLDFTWKKEQHCILVMLAYEEEYPHSILFKQHGPAAEDGAFSWDIGSRDNVYIYAAFYRIISGELSDSVYGGKV